jgi:hypothetical protein
LPAVDDVLVEDAVLIAYAIADGGDLQRRQRVHETGGQTPQAAVAQAGFFLQAEGAVDVSFGTTAKTGPIAFTASDTMEPRSLQWAPIYLARDEALAMTLSTTVQVNGWVTYVIR